MKTLATLTGLLVMALVIGSCESGPSGPDPGIELRVDYLGNIKQELTESRTAVVWLSDVESPPDRFEKFKHITTINSRVSADKIELYNTSFPGQGPVLITVHLGDELPTSPGTYPWINAQPNGKPSGGVEVLNGIKILYTAGNTYYPVSGETVVLNVRREGQSVVFIEGYFTGELMNTSGQTMKVQSGLFKHPRP